MTDDLRGPSRDLARPQAGWWLIRLAKGAPRVAACIRSVQTTHEPGQPDNDMTGTRSPFLAAFVLDEPVDIDRVWLTRGEVITESEYRYRCADHAWLEKNDPGHPMAAPAEPIDLLTAPVPF